MDQTTKEQSVFFFFPKKTQQFSVSYLYNILLHLVYLMFLLL